MPFPRFSSYADEQKMLYKDNLFLISVDRGVHIIIYSIQALLTTSD